MPIDTNSESHAENENAGGKNEEPESSCDENQDHLSKELAVGAAFENLDDVYSLYCDYARTIGFSVKKGTQANFKGTLVIRQKVYLCSCEGPPDEKRCQNTNPKYRKQVWQSNCKARPRVLRVQEEGPWTVSVFVTEHNHELIPQPDSHLLRTHSCLTMAKSTLIESFYKAGIGVAKCHRFMSNQVGGPHNVGFTKDDAYHHIATLTKNIRVVDGDSAALYNHLIERSNNHNGYHWNVKVDSEGRLEAFYFRDYRSAVDYEYFGDVMSVDTMYRTNRYNLFCLPFIGVNHHRKNVMFGCGFVSDETTESFEWLFKEFLKSMNGKEPQTIFSDQCYALMNVVDNTFLTTSHRLCQWHISRSAASKIRKLNSNPQFKKVWDYLMKGCETGGEFEVLWKKMLADHKETDSKWFKKMFKQRRRWSTAYTNMKFSGGLFSTQRSESTNRAIKVLSSATTRLSDFVDQFEQVQNDWRAIETVDDVANCGKPGLVLNTRFLSHVSEFYTRDMVRMYEYESNLSVDLHIVSLKDDSVDKLPDEYILRLWKKDAKNRFTDDRFLLRIGGEPNGLHGLEFIYHNTRLVYDLTLECRDDDENKAIVNDVIQKLVKRVKRNMIEKKKGNADEEETRKRFRDPKVPDRKTGDKRFRHPFDSPHSKSNRSQGSRKTGTPPAATHARNSKTMHFSKSRLGPLGSESFCASDSISQRKPSQTSGPNSEHQSVPPNSRRGIFEFGRKMFVET